MKELVILFVDLKRLKIRWTQGILLSHSCQISEGICLLVEIEAWYELYFRLALKNL